VSSAISAISFWSLAGIRDRPRDFDFHLQNSRKPLRCHGIKESALATVGAIPLSLSSEGLLSERREKPPCEFSVSEKVNSPADVIFAKDNLASSSQPVLQIGGVMTKPFRTTVTGSYPRPVQPADTLKKPSLSRQEADEMIRWAARDQVDAGLDVITDGEVRRENMYYFVQKRVDGLSFDQMEYRTYGKAGFGIEIAAVVDRIANPRLELARD
jgi:hypothetical protein